MDMLMHCKSLKENATSRTLRLEAKFNLGLSSYVVPSMLLVSMQKYYHMYNCAHNCKISKYYRRKMGTQVLTSSDIN